MARNNQRGSKNNNPEGRNQFSSSWRDTARERPLAAAATAAAAVGAGVFLWSRRNQISEQISNLSDQVGEWAGNMQSGSSQGGSGGSGNGFEYSEGRSDFSGSAASTGSGGGNRSRGKGGKGSQGFGEATGSTGSMSSSAEDGSSSGTTAGDRAF